MNILRTTYHTIAAKNTGLVLLTLVGIFTILGSAVLPNGFYHTILFKLLLLLLFLNITLCTVKQLVRLYSGLFKGGTTFNRRIRQTGILLLHAGIVFILAGGSIYTYYGQSKPVNLVAGDTIDISDVIKTTPPFSLHLDNFNIEFNADGSPSQYYSNITVTEESQVRQHEEISVNHPLHYRGIKAYQESYGYLVKAKYGTDNKIETVLNEGESFSVPGTNRVVKLYKYIPDYDPNMGMNSKTLQPDNPRIIFSVYQNDILLGVGLAQFGEKIEIAPNSYVVFSGVEPYTVLKIKSDPGLPLALTGGIMLILGVLLTLLFLPVKYQHDDTEINDGGTEKYDAENLVDNNG